MENNLNSRFLIRDLITKNFVVSFNATTPELQNARKFASHEEAETFLKENENKFVSYFKFISFEIVKIYFLR